MTIKVTETVFPRPGVKSKAPGYLLAAAGAVLFATKGILAKLAYGSGAAPQVDAITLLTLRMAFAMPVFAVIGAHALKARHAKGLRLTMRQLLSAALVGALGYYVSSYLDFAGLQYLTAQFERLILMTYPVFVAIFGALFFGLRLTKAKLGALIVSYSGIVFIFATGATAQGPNALLGVALVFAASITFALYNLLARPLIAEIGADLFTSVAMLAACVGVGFHFLMVKSAADLGAAPAHAVWIAATMAITATLLPSFMISMALLRVGAQAVSLIGTISPVATIFMAMALLDEPFTIADAIGTSLVIAGIALFTWADARGAERQSAMENA